MNENYLPSPGHGRETMTTERGVVSVNNNNNKKHGFLCM